MPKVEALANPGREAPGDEWLERLARYLRGKEAQAVLCIVPTRDAAARLQERLLADFGVPGLFGRRIRTFYSLSREIVETRRLGRHNLSDLQRSLLVKHIADTADIPALAPIQRFPGFATALGELIGELKLAMIHPPDLRRATDKLPRSESALRAKLRDLLTLYERYQEILEDERHPLHDAEGLMWHAVSALEDEKHEAPEPLACVSTVFFHGFRSFNRVQLRLLRSIAASAREVHINLQHDPTRPEAFAASGRALEALQESLGLTPRTAESSDDRGDIEHVTANLFRPEAERKPSDGSVIILEAGSPALEADQVAREIHRLIAEERVCHSEIAIIARGKESQERFAHLLARREVPTRRRTEPLAASAVGGALTAALRVMRERWPVSAAGALLKSPCLRGDVVERARAEVNAWEQGVREGRDAWFAQWQDDDTLEVRERALGPVRDSEDRLRRARSAGDMAEAVRGFLDRLERPDVYPEPDAAARRDEDMARSELDRVIREVEYIAGLAGQPPAWETFCEDLERAVAEASYDPGPHRSEGVAILDAQALGGETYSVVFAVNLLEKVFPAQVREDPFLRDRERGLLAEVSERKVGLEPSSYRQDEERLLFWRTVSCATERLYLSYPTADEAAKESLPSFYLDEVRRLFAPETLTERRRSFSDLAPPPTGAISQDDWAACIFHGFARELQPPQQAEHAAHYNAWLGCGEARPDVYVCPTPPSADALADPLLLAALDDRDRPYHPSELESYLTCPYLYYCERLLDLHPVEREIAPADYGVLLHDVLARLYRGLDEPAGGPIDVERLDPEKVVERALQVLDECLASEPRFANLPRAQREIERQWSSAVLERFVRADLEKTAQRKLRPAYFELSFGSPPRRGADERSLPHPLDLGEVEGHGVSISGRMDRVDLTPDGAAVIIDYKLGKGLPDMREVDEGLILQAPLYALAVRELFGRDIAGAEYVSIRSGERRGLYCGEELAARKSRYNLVVAAEDLDSKLELAARSACECVGRIRRGEIPRGPREECPAWCGYRGICRMDAWTLRRIQSRRGRTPVRPASPERRGAADA